MRELTGSYRWQVFIWKIQAGHVAVWARGHVCTTCGAQSGPVITKVVQLEEGRLC
jgi:hypothetical protein